MRMPHDHVNEDAQAFAPALYASWQEIYGRLPCILFSGLAATTIMRIEGILYVQSPTREGYNPIPCPLAPLEPEWVQVRHFPGTLEYCTSARSFKSFFEKVGKGIRSVFKYIVKNVVPITRVVTGMGKLML